MSTERIEYAVVERGYEDQVNPEDCYGNRDSAEFQASIDRYAGLDVHVMMRTVTVGDWTDVPAEEKAT